MHKRVSKESMKYDEEEGIMYITFSLVMVMGIKEAMLAERAWAVIGLQQRTVVCGPDQSEGRFSASDRRRKEDLYFQVRNMQ